MKMKTHFFVIIYLLIVTNAAFSQITFQKTYGGVQDDAFYCVRQTTDAGYIMVGYTMSFGNGNYDIYLVKTDSIGDTTWTKTFGGTGRDIGYSVQQTTDSGYIISGQTNSLGPGFDLAFLIKINANGDTLWTKYYLANNSQNGHSGAKGLSVKQTMDGGFIVDCSAYVNGDELLLIKTDGSGDTLWTKSYGMHILDFGSEVQQTTDSGYIITGSRGYEVYLLKTDRSGNLIWKKAYQGTNDLHGFSVKQTSDGGFIVIGYYNTLTGGAYLIKTNSIGDTLWTKAYGGNSGEAAYSFDITSDSGYIIAGYTQSFGAGQGEGYLIKTNAMGDTSWTKVIGGIFRAGFFSVQQISGGGYILAGGFGAGNADAYLIKTDANGNSGCNESSTATIVRTPTTIVSTPIDTDSLAITSVFVNSYSLPTSSGGVINTLCITTSIGEIGVDNAINIYPNPAQDFFIVNIMEEVNNAKVEIYNVLGENIYSTTLENNHEVINCNELLSGIYFITVRMGDKRITKKLIVNK